MRFMNTSTSGAIGGLLAALASAGARSVVAPSYSEHQELSYYLSESGAKQPIESVEDGQIRRSHVLVHVQTVMGPMPQPAQPVPRP